MENELKPCPFCGGEAVLRVVPHTEITPYYVRCDSAACSVHVATCLRNTPEEAVELWNRRVNEEVTHGRWVEKPHKMMGEAPACSECGGYNPIETRYCRNCGARMLVDSCRYCNKDGKRREDGNT